MDNKKVTIVDYGLGNLFSIAQAILHVGGTPFVTADKNEILAAQHLILPGVGAFGNAMQKLNELDLASPLLDYIAEGKPIMGVCLGMQILFESSEEFGNHKGLGVIKGDIRKFPSHDNEGKLVKVPQTGWNQINPVNLKDWKESPLKKVDHSAYMYFVHSYYANLKENVGLSTTAYAGIEYCSSVKKNNVVAFQFHPEKSGEEGLSIYKEFMEMKNAL